MEDDGNFIPDSEVDDYINDAIDLLYSILVDGTDGTLFAKNAPILNKIGDNAYQLPGDFHQLVDVAVFVGHTYIRSIQADPQDYAQLTTQNYNGQAYTRHFLQWNVEQNRAELFIFPAPSQTQDIAVRYIPTPPVLELDSDELGFPSFFYQWVVLDTAVQMANKEESNTEALLFERDKVEKRIRDHIRSMTPTRVKTIRNVSRWDERNSRFALPTINYRSG